VHTIFKLLINVATHVHSTEFAATKRRMGLLRYSECRYLFMISTSDLLLLHRWFCFATGVPFR